MYFIYECSVCQYVCMPEEGGAVEVTLYPLAFF